MRTLLRNDRGDVRDGWKALFFLLASMGCFVVVGIAGRLWPAAWKPYAPSALLIAVLGLLLTALALRLEGGRLRDVGLRFDRRFLSQLALGLLGGALLAATSAGLVMLAGVDLVRIEPPSAAAQIKFTMMVLGGAVFEELLFRGYAFQRTVRGLGAWPALAVFALLFTLGHLPGNTGMEATLAVNAVAGLVLHAVIMGLILLRTGSLAVPIGLHAAWNLVQGLLGFGVSGLAHPAWFRPDFGSLPGWLTGGAYGLEASVLPLVLEGLLLVWLLRGPRPTARLAERRAAHATA